MLAIALITIFAGITLLILMGRSLLYWKRFSFHTPESVRKTLIAYLSGAAGILLLLIGFFWLF